MKFKVKGYYKIPNINNIKNIFKEFGLKIESLKKSLDYDIKYLMNIINSLKEIKENIQVYKNLCDNYINNYDINHFKF